MANNPTDYLPQFAVPGLPPTMAAIPRVQPAPTIAYTPPPVVAPTAPTAIGQILAAQRASGALAAYGVPTRSIPAAAPATPSAPVTTAATPAPAPATPVAPAAAPAATPADASSAVSPTPGAGNPLPPNLRGDVGLPDGTPAGAPNMAAVANLPAPRTGTASAYTPQAADSGPEIIRAGVVSNPGGSVVPASGIRDPQAAINAGFDFQTARAENFIGQAMNYVNAGGNIFERATRGRFVNGLLAATVGPNNVGQVQGMGQDSLNSALAGVEAAGIGANAQEYGANLGYQENAARIAATRDIEQLQRQNTPTIIGQRTYKNALGLITQEPVYGLPTLNAQGQATQFNPISTNGMVTNPSAPVPEPQNPAVGTTRTRASGAVERWDGKSWAREEK